MTGSNRPRAWRVAGIGLLALCLPAGILAEALLDQESGARKSGPPVVEPLSVLDVEGQAVRPLESPAAKAVVLVFVRTDCPISNRYAPEVRRLHERFADRGVDFWTVYTDPNESADTIRKHVREYGYPGRAVRDPGHALVKAAAARVTPEAAVFVPAAGGPRLVYHGRIDDRYVDFGRMRAAPANHDLEDALEALIAGRPAPRETAPAVGCFLSDPP